MSARPFQFKRFSIAQDRCAVKIGTDAILLGAWAKTRGVRTALDVGTGTGIIAIMLTQRNPEIKVDAVDIDPAAAAQARENMANSPWSDRLQVFPVSVQEYVRNCEEKYDLIISNPPFFSGGTLSKNHDRNQIRHTVKLPSGELLAAARNLLAPQGRLAVILPHIEGHRFMERSEQYRLYCSRITEVRSRPGKPAERLLMEFSRQKTGPIKDCLIIHEGNDDQAYSPEYTELTRAFYLYMPD